MLFSNFSKRFKICIIGKEVAKNFLHELQIDSATELAKWPQLKISLLILNGLAHLSLKDNFCSKY